MLNKKIIFVAIPLAIAFLIGFGILFIITSRQSALDHTLAHLSFLHKNGSQDLEQSLLLSALVNFPENPELKIRLDELIEWKKGAERLSQRDKELDLERRDRLEKRIEALEEGVLDYQKSAASKQADLDRKLVQALNSNGLNAAQDYYFRITGKRIVPPTPRNDSRIQALIAQGSDAADRGSWLMAKDQALEALKLDPSSGRAAVLWCFISIMEAPESSEVKTKVVPLMEGLQKDFPGDFYLSFGLGKAYRFLGQWRLAEDALTKAFEKRPTSREVRLEVGAFYNDKKDYTKVRSLLDPLWKEGVRDDSMGQVLWLAREGVQDFGNAETFLGEWKKAAPRSFLPDFYWGNYWVFKGDLAKATASYQDSVSVAPNRQAYIKLAQILESQGLSLKASHAWRGLLSLFNQSLQEGRKEYQKYSPLYIHSLFRAKAYGQVISDGTGIIKAVDPGNERDLMILEVSDSLKTMGKWPEIRQLVPGYIALLQDEKFKTTLEEIRSMAEQQEKR